MSLFLAPIHYWLFNKIKIQEEIELSLVDAFSIEYGEKPIEIHNNLVSKYGELFINSDSKLEDIIDTSNIHGWLQNAIDTVELRQSNYIKELLDNYMVDALSIINTVFSNLGNKSGSEIAENYESIDALALYNAIYDYLIDGMPCDNVREVIESNENEVVYRHINCLHKKYWDEFNLDPELMYEFRTSWTKSFISKASNRRYEYDFSIENSTHKIYIVQ